MHAQPAPATIVVIGDSLSAAYGIARDDGWVALLEQRLATTAANYRVINASITGDTTHGGLSRLPALLQRTQAAIVIIELGGNDGLRGLSLARTQTNLRTMIHASRAAGAQVLLLGMRLPANYGPIYGEQFAALYRALADTEQVALVDFFLTGVAETLDLMQADGIHPGAAAQPRMLENVWQALQPLLITAPESTVPVPPSGEQ